jgi:hypothetical protein
MGSTMSAEPAETIELEQPVREASPTVHDSDEPMQALRELLESDSAPIVALVLALI